MGIQRDIENLMDKKSITMKQLIKQLALNNWQISEKQLLKKFSDKTIRFQEIQLIVDILGYELKFRKK